MKLRDFLRFEDEAQGAEAPRRCGHCSCASVDSGPLAGGLSAFADPDEVEAWIDQLTAAIDEFRNVAAAMARAEAEADG